MNDTETLRPVRAWDLRTSSFRSMFDSLKRSCSLGGGRSHCLTICLQSMARIPFLRDGVRQRRGGGGPWLGHDQ